MAGRQITIRLSPESKNEFERYSHGLGFDRSEVVRLLIAREYRVRRLRILKDAGNVPMRSRQQHGAGIRYPSITAHLPSHEAVEEFDAYARDCGLNRDNAGAWLIIEELKERWLDRILSAL